MLEVQVCILDLLRIELRLTEGSIFKNNSAAKVSVERWDYPIRYARLKTHLLLNVLAVNNTEPDPSGSF